VSKVREKMDMDVSPMVGGGNGFGYLEIEKKTMFGSAPLFVW
jgi:hypothetical protein